MVGEGIIMENFNLEDIKELENKWQKDHPEEDSFIDIKNDGACLPLGIPVHKDNTSKDETCGCYTCQHKFEPALLQAYYQGQVDALGSYLTWLQEDLKIEFGPCDGNSIESLVTQMDYEYYGNCMLLAEAEQDNNKTKANLYIKNFSFNTIINDAPFLAFYKKNRKYKIFVKTLNFRTNKYELTSFGDGIAYKEDILKEFDKIIYMNKIFESLQKIESLKDLIQNPISSD